MIGTWQRFGEGEPPQDGEMLVYLRDSGADIIDLLEGHSAHELVSVVHRSGYLTERSGSGYSVGSVSGLLWTSLPPMRLHPTYPLRSAPPIFRLANPG